MSCRRNCILKARIRSARGHRTARKPNTLDRARHAKRNRIKRMMGFAASLRRVAARYVKTAASVPSFVQITTVHRWMRFVRTAWAPPARQRKREGAQAAPRADQLAISPGTSPAASNRIGPEAPTYRTSPPAAAARAAAQFPGRTGGAPGAVTSRIAWASRAPPCPPDRTSASAITIAAS